MPQRFYGLTGGVGAATGMVSQAGDLNPIPVIERTDAKPIPVGYHHNAWRACNAHHHLQILAGRAGDDW